MHDLVAADAVCHSKYSTLLRLGREAPSGETPSKIHKQGEQWSEQRSLFENKTCRGQW